MQSTKLISAEREKELFYNMPYAARASLTLYGIWMIPCPDCEVEWKNRCSLIKIIEHG